MWTDDFQRHAATLPPWERAIPLRLRQPVAPEGPYQQAAANPTGADLRGLPARPHNGHLRGHRDETDSYKAEETVPEGTTWNHVQLRQRRRPHGRPIRPRDPLRRLHDQPTAHVESRGRLWAPEDACFKLWYFPQLRSWRWQAGKQGGARLEVKKA